MIATQNKMKTILVLIFLFHIKKTMENNSHCLIIFKGECIFAHEGHITQIGKIVTIKIGNPIPNCFNHGFHNFGNEIICKECLNNKYGDKCEHDVPVDNLKHDCKTYQRIPDKYNIGNYIFLCYNCLLNKTIIDDNECGIDKIMKLPESCIENFDGICYQSISPDIYFKHQEEFNIEKHKDNHISGCLQQHDNICASCLVNYYFNHDGECIERIDEKLEKIEILGENKVEEDLKKLIKI